MHSPNTNYLRPDIKRGNITRDEEELIIRLHKLLGNRYIFFANQKPYIFITCTNQLGTCQYKFDKTKAITVPHQSD